MERVKLEVPEYKSTISVEEAIAGRKSRRAFKHDAIKRREFALLVWAASKAPSAGATYPLELYLVIGAGAVEHIEPGVYHVENGYLEPHKDGDLRVELATACLRQMFIADASFSIVITAEYERTTRRYGERGIRYVHIEAGHVSQNIYLECEALGLATVAIGAFDDDEVAKVLNLPEAHKPIYVMPIGVKI
ncbi:MAG: nitroreductase [Candidatus Methanophagaceae archaeon]|nr:MAG: nitroreductase [Methanophagales archaeon]